MIFLSLLPVPHATAVDELLYEDFTTLHGMWIANDGDWTSGGGVLEGLGLNNDWNDIICTSPAFDEVDYTIAFDVLIHEG